MDPKLLEQRARAFDYLFDAVVVTDLEGMIIDWNVGAERLYGYTREEAIGRHVGFLHASEERDRITKEIFSAIEKDGSWTGESEMRRGDGEVGWVESVVVPVFDEENVPIGALGINRDISDRVRTKEQLARMAHYDQLTDLPNRALLLERLQRMVVWGERNKDSFAVLFIDLDDFKDVNDELGHAAGDLVLREAGQRMAESVRDTDTVARVGGDEFVVLVADVRDEGGVGTVVRNIKKSLRPDFVINGRSVRVAASIGVAIYPRDGKTPTALLVEADRAMYRAKAASDLSAPEPTSD